MHACTKDKIVGYGSTLITQGIAYLEEKWGTKRLAVPDHMQAPLLRILHLPFIQGFSDKMESGPTDVFKGKNLELQKLILDKFDVQIAVVVVEGKLMARLAVFVYNTMDDFIRLGEAVLDLTKDKKE